MLHLPATSSTFAWGSPRPRPAVSCQLPEQELVFQAPHLLVSTFLANWQPQHCGSLSSRCWMLEAGCFYSRKTVKQFGNETVFGAERSRPALASATSPLDLNTPTGRAQIPAAAQLAPSSNFQVSAPHNSGRSLRRIGGNSQRPKPEPDVDIRCKA
ncbi:hypothetical protein ACLKA6_019989 [Drosophila palustris]